MLAMMTLSSEFSQCQGWQENETSQKEIMGQMINTGTRKRFTQRSLQAQHLHTFNKRTSLSMKTIKHPKNKQLKKEYPCNHWGKEKKPHSTPSSCIMLDEKSSPFLETMKIYNLLCYLFKMATNCNSCMTTWQESSHLPSPGSDNEEPQAALNTAHAVINTYSRHPHSNNTPTPSHSITATN